MFSFNSTATVLLAATFCVAACGGSDGRREQQPMQDKMRAQPQELTLKGCVQSGTLETTFVLQNAHVQPAPVNSSAQTQPATGPITEGSIVQLRVGDGDDLRQHVGKEVTVRGTIADTGENTIGTAGAQGNAVPSGDRSMAADRSKDFEEKKKAEAGRIARESMANGSAPILRVLEIKPTGGTCSEQQPRER
jgi:hypothetical protein